MPPAPAAQSTPAGGENTPEVADHACLNCDLPHTGTGALTGVIRAHHYTEVYNQIPFSRSEYDANPAYRHDATMELLLGQIRPVTYQTTNVNVATGVESMDQLLPRFLGLPLGLSAFRLLCTQISDIRPLVDCKVIEGSRDGSR